MYLQKHAEKQKSTHATHQKSAPGKPTNKQPKKHEKTFTYTRKKANNNKMSRPRPKGRVSSPTVYSRQTYPAHRRRCIFDGDVLPGRRLGSRGCPSGPPGGLTPPPFPRLYYLSAVSYADEPQIELAIKLSDDVSEAAIRSGTTSSYRMINPIYFRTYLTRSW